MTKKDIFKNDILMAMKHHLKADQMAILENVLSEALYRVDIPFRKNEQFLLTLTPRYLPLPKNEPLNLVEVLYSPN